MANESICAEFPDTWEGFVEKWAYDVEVQDENNYDFQVKQVVDVYRVKQMMWYYLKDYLRLGVSYPSEGYKINIVENRSRQNGDPFFIIERRNIW